MHPTRTRGPPGNSSPAACHRWPGTRCPAGHSGPWARVLAQTQPGPQHPCCSRRPHHEVPAKHQGHDLRLRRCVAIVVTGQVPTAPLAGPPARLSVVAWAEHAVEAEQQQHEDDAGGQAERRHPAPDRTRSGGPRPLPLAAPSSWALLVQGDVSVGLCHAWPLRTGLPEPIGPGLRWGPGTVSVLRVPPLQGLPRVQAERDRDDRQQADVPGTGQWAASARMPWEGSPAAAAGPLHPPGTLHTGLFNLPNSKTTLSGSLPQIRVGHRRLLPSLALVSQPCFVTDTSTPAAITPVWATKHRMQTSGFPSDGEGACSGDGELTPPGGRWQLAQLTHLLASVIL